GMGKTSLAEALARSCGLDFRRVSFTSDLLPADLTGISIYNQTSQSFCFQPGPIFSQVLLADEINRASPRTQSALLEAMASGQVSVDGISHPLPQPFAVIATQNGLDQTGTAPLPESQLDRFLMRISLGFPAREAEAQLLRGEGLPLAQLVGQITAVELLEMQQQAKKVHCSDALLAYVLDLLAASRTAGNGSSLSPRAGQALMAAARSWALITGRNHCEPDDVVAVFAAVAEHRLDGGHHQGHGNSLSNALLHQVDGLR
ncbi:MAG: AAA family ATPase, partial [Betaproteobacteria bacterium]|nr:AAA family ATPase [Betaproteobacteria bacterium]